MKKLLSLSLAALTLTSALASCAPAKDRLDSSIALASSEAIDSAKWLDERLDTFPTDVVVGIGSNEAYGVDMTDFEADGYVVRTIGEETFIFGASADGLDRAVRKYAKAAESGAAEDIDEVYHEGYRIERLTIAGSDISEYSIYVPADRNPSVDFAAEELQLLIEKACGTVLPVKEGTPAGKYFSFSILDDDTVNDGGYKYKVENGNILIEGKADFGCPNGVYRFLQNECGWEDLCYGNALLAEADHVDVKDGVSFVGNPRFNYYTPSGSVPIKTDHRAPTPEACNYGFINGYLYTGGIRHANHGIQVENFIEYDWASTASGGGEQPCYSSDKVYEEMFDNVTYYIDARLDSGMVIGKDFKYVDVSHPDVSTFCLCKDCMKVFKEEGRTNAGAVVRFTNRLIDDLDRDYDGLKYLIFGYQGTQIPCKTKPHEDIYVTFCTDRCCANHSLDDPECTEGTEYKGTTYTNVKMSEWLKGWVDISSRVYVWHYGLDSSHGSNNHFDTLYEDITFLSRIGVYGVYMDFEYRSGIAVTRPLAYLTYSIVWDRDMTKEEYLAEKERILEKEYGDGWYYVDECLDIWAEGEQRFGCFNCWDAISQYCEINYEYSAEYYDTAYEYSKRAIDLANDREQELRCVKFFGLTVYQGTNCAYFNAYNAEDTKKLALLEERWAEMISEYERFDIDISALLLGLSRTAEEEAWTAWKRVRDLYTDPDISPRPIPEKYR